MPMPERPKIVYVVSVCDEAGRLDHLPRFIEELERKAQVGLLIGRAVQAPKLMVSSIRVVTNSSDPNRLGVFFKFMTAIFKFYNEGYRIFFVRTSTPFAIALGILSKVLPIATYFWHCGQAKNV